MFCTHSTSAVQKSGLPAWLCCCLPSTVLAGPAWWLINNTPAAPYRLALLQAEVPRVLVQSSKGRVLPAAATRRCRCRARCAGMTAAAVAAGVGAAAGCRPCDDALPHALLRMVSLHRGVSWRSAAAAAVDGSHDKMGSESCFRLWPGSQGATETGWCWGVGTCASRQQTVQRQAPPQQLHVLLLLLLLLLLPAVLCASH